VAEPIAIWLASISTRGGGAMLYTRHGVTRAAAHLAQPRVA